MLRDAARRRRRGRKQFWSRSNAEAEKLDMAFGGCRLALGRRHLLALLVLVALVTLLALFAFLALGRRLLVGAYDLDRTVDATAAGILGARDADVSRLGKQQVLAVRGRVDPLVERLLETV